MKYALILVSLLSFMAYADNEMLFKQGQEAYSKRDYTKAMELWLPLAKSGMPDAQDTVAHLYSQGLGAPKNIEKAIFWYKRSAEQGHPEAKYRLAEYYRTGRGVEKDLKKAEVYFREALCGGYSYAIVSLVTLHQEGLMEVRNQKERSSIEREAKKIEDPSYREYLIQRTRANLDEKRSKERLESQKMAGCA